MNTNKITKIVTHGGIAHSDELLAVALLLAKFTDAVVVRVPSVAKEDLEDPTTIVVDVGNSYDPVRGNFDHHQDRNLPSSLILVLRHFFPGISVDLEELQWLSDWDVLGPVATQKKWGLRLPEFRDPLVEIILRLFSKAEVIKPGDSLHGLLIVIGTEFLTYLREQGELIEKAKAAKVYQVKGLKVVEVSYNIPIRFIKQVHRDVAIVVQPNQREPGKISITRVDNHPRVDFNRTKNMQGISFVHQTGFMAVADPSVVSEILERAIE